MKINASDFFWTRKPKDYSISDEKIEIITAPHTDLWQRTYYHFINDNTPVLQMKTSEKFFSFIVKTEFESKHRFEPVRGCYVSGQRELAERLHRI